MKKISWTDRLKYVEVLHVVNEETNNPTCNKKKEFYSDSSPCVEPY